MERIPEKIDSKYRYVLLASLRAEQIVVGAATKAEIESAKPTRLGMHEITADLVEWDYGPAEEPEKEALGDEVAGESAEGAEG